MKAEIIAIGSELTSGQNLDTNSRWLSQRLAQIGIRAGWHTTVADELEANVEVFRIATRRAGLVVATGGLGPTQDDLTRQALARLAGVELVFDAASDAAIRAMFARRGRAMPERNRVQAMLPHGAEPIPNACGTAPGIWMPVGQCLVVALPGVPSEMEAMFTDQVQPRLRALGLAGEVLIERRVNCFGAGESAVEEKVLDLTRRDHVPEVGITVSDGTISLRILGRGGDEADARSRMAPVERIIRERLGELVFGVDGEGLEDAVVRLLRERGRSIATAEGVTAGLVAHLLGRVPGASACLRGGIVAYANRAVEEMLGVPADLINPAGIVSTAVAEYMAVACRERFGTDLAVSTVGIAGPGGATPTKPVGLVFAAVAWDHGVRSVPFNWSGTRLEIQMCTAKLALNQARLALLRR